MEGRKFEGGLLWPVILIGAGIVFLLNNLGMLDWSIWLTLLQLWPVLLIAAGLDILVGRKSMLGSAIIALLLVGFLALTVTGAIHPPTVAAGSVVERTEEVRFALDGAERADITVNFGTGRLTLGALPADSGDLLTGALDLSRDEQLQQSHSVDGGRARVSLMSNNTWTAGVSMAHDGKQWELAMNRDVPVALSLDAGVGESDLDLSQLTLNRLDINGGVGDVTVKLPATGRFDVELDGGVGKITVIVPEALAARVRIDGGLGSTDVTGDFEKNDDEYVSPGFASAENRVDIRIDGGIGRIEVRQATE
jgi:hypothetical protein